MSANTVEFQGHYGGDRTHALSAWTSTYRDIHQDKWERMPQLLAYLAEHKHETPYEKSTLHFLVRCETASHIHILKHRIAVSVNGESARYKELGEPTGYIPPDWPEATKERLRAWYEAGSSLYGLALTELEPLLGRKRAKESARFFLPYSNQLTLDVMFNWRSFNHFLGLRHKPDAQREIDSIAGWMLAYVQQIEGNPFEHTLAAWGY